ncbi:AraC family transcriptional regulator [Echinicola jeungdonensis]|uniref:AraC family transcriptional regulator n=1 Tax=Echinicola jeungdonensis TaxID=709343 RepID=A0ABV5J3I1_9BACT|nr:AraC family transcriptional regulator [Echinicola jeungdonensis]MDN3669631.1 AraC family transcriptional regulator [Echinicola jeungdonensis]
MKPFVQKLPKQEFKSFVSVTFSTPLFETPWHRHLENEILYIKKGYGTAIIGDFVGEFSEGDLFYIGSNVPHWFRKANEDLFCTVVVIQFDKSIFGNSFLNIPELAQIKKLINLKQALSVNYELDTSLIEKIKGLEDAEGFDHMSRLLAILNSISIKTKNSILTHEHINSFDSKGIIDEIMEYTFNHFQENIKLEDIAGLAKMSESNFRRFFKLNTKKSFSKFLKEIRIAHACKLLKDKNLFVSQIFHDCGYRNITNFNRQFKEIKGITPSAYRAQVLND